MNILSLEKPGLIPGSVAKVDHDLHMGFEDGETLVLQDFYLLGDSGEYSLLLDTTGQPVASGLSAPVVDRVARAETLIYADEVGQTDAVAQQSSDPDAGLTGGTTEVPLWAAAGGAVLIGAQELASSETEAPAENAAAIGQAGATPDAAPQDGLDLGDVVDCFLGDNALGTVLFQESAFPLISEMGEGL
ncbi:hypothetical protein [Shimia aestuarii]|uniref:hypothetical protein n=1 Tax=Shimia aestuarii TaxID=254406 RepID=UPI001FB36D72|nr:hypothetical protein [Shimia aestuarii]